MLGGPGAGSVLCSTARPRVSLLTRVPPWLGGVPGGGVGVPRGCKAALFILIFFLPIFSIRGFVPASLFTGRSISTANLPCLQATRCASSHRAGADTSSPYRSIGLGGGGGLMLTSRQRSPISGLTLTLLAPDSQPHLLQRPVAPPSLKRSRWHPGVLGWMGGGQTGTRLRGAPWCLFLPQSPLPWRDHRGGLVLTGAPHEVMVPLPPHCMATCGGLTACPHVWGSAICQHDIPAAEGCLPCRVAGGQAGPRGGGCEPRGDARGPPSPPQRERECVGRS